MLGTKTAFSRASSALAIILNKKLFVANAGDTRAVVCRKNPATGDLNVIRLSVDHVLANEDEMLRLCQLGIEDPETALGSPGYTRCLGFHNGKRGYQEVEALRVSRE